MLINCHRQISGCYEFVFVNVMHSLYICLVCNAVASLSLSILIKTHIFIRSLQFDHIVFSACCIHRIFSLLNMFKSGKRISIIIYRVSTSHLQEISKSCYITNKSSMLNHIHTTTTTKTTTIIILPNHPTNKSILTSTLLSSHFSYALCTSHS